MRRNHTFGLLSLAVLTGFTALACGGDDDDGGSSAGITRTESANIADDKPASELTTEENEALCRDFSTSASRTLGNLDVCGLGAAIGTAFAASLADGQITDSQLQDLCQQSVDSCKEQGTEEVDTSTIDCTDSEAAIPEGCDATVGELLGCYDALLKAFAGLPSSCGSVTSANAEEIAGSLQNITPEECTSLPAACQASVPDLSGGLGDFGGDFEAEEQTSSGGGSDAPAQ